MTINELSIEQYLQLSEKEKIQFYQQIYKYNPKAKGYASYATKSILSKQAKVPKFLFKQDKGHLTYIAPLIRTDKNIRSLYFLVVCDCGKWAIVEAIKFRQQKQIQCVFCSLENITTMKDISGNVYGQLQALYPLNIRASDGSVYWQCKCIDCGNEQKVIKNNLEKNGHLCAICGRKSKGEYKISKILQDLDIPFEKEKTFEDCRFEDTKAYAKFDFFINNNYIIEVDGQHHYKPVDYSGKLSEEEKQKLYLKVISHDRYKNQYCIRKNIPLIRIPYFALENISYIDLDIKTSKFLIN